MQIQGWGKQGQGWPQRRSSGTGCVCCEIAIATRFEKSRATRTECYTWIYMYISLDVTDTSLARPTAAARVASECLAGRRQPECNTLRSAYRFKTRPSAPTRSHSLIGANAHRIRIQATDLLSMPNSSTTSGILESCQQRAKGKTNTVLPRRISHAI